VSVILCFSAFTYRLYIGTSGSFVARASPATKPDFGVLVDVYSADLRASVYEFETLAMLGRNRILASLMGRQLPKREHKLAWGSLSVIGARKLSHGREVGLLHVNAGPRLILTQFVYSTLHTDCSSGIDRGYCTQKG